MKFKKNILTLILLLNLSSISYITQCYSMNNPFNKNSIPSVVKNPVIEDNEKLNLYKNRAEYQIALEKFEIARQENKICRESFKKKERLLSKRKNIFEKAKYNYTETLKLKEKTDKFYNFYKENQTHRKVSALQSLLDNPLSQKRNVVHLAPNHKQHEVKLEDYKEHKCNNNSYYCVCPNCNYFIWPNDMFTINDNPKLTNFIVVEEGQKSPCYFCPRCLCSNFRKIPKYIPVDNGFTEAILKEYPKLEEFRFNKTFEDFTRYNYDKRVQNYCCSSCGHIGNTDYLCGGCNRSSTLCDDFVMKKFDENRICLQKKFGICPNNTTHIGFIDDVRIRKFVTRYTWSRDNLINMSDYFWFYCYDCQKHFLIPTSVLSD